jgi:hypothetical protein
MLLTDLRMRCMICDAYQHRSLLKRYVAVRGT